MKVLPRHLRPLDGLVVADFSQFLSGPLASLRLADLGARVIKIERPGTGDLCRHLYLTDTEIGGDNTLFHAINRNKQSITADLREPADRERLEELVAVADVLIENFRPGVIERLGFGYSEARKVNPRIVYGSISGYGREGPWTGFPGQDLLAQSRSGLLWLTGSAGDPPVPMGLAVADILAGNTLAQAILAALVGRGIHGRGAHVETSLFEVMIDFQFEVLTTHLNDGHRMPKRSEFNGAHAYLGAPYGVYETLDGHLAIAMTPSLQNLAELMEVSGLEQYLDDPKSLFRHRDAIKRILAEAISRRTTADWLAVLQPADIWCSEVFDWKQLLASEAYRVLDFQQVIRRGDDVAITALRGPIRFDGGTLKSETAAPGLGQHNDLVEQELASGSMRKSCPEQAGHRDET